MSSYDFKKYLLLATILILNTSYLLGQDHVRSNQTRFEVLSMKDGLPANSANAFVQDKEGYLWIGSFGGLSRYDGHEFKTYREDKSQLENSLVDNYVMSLSMDKAGYLWLGTMRKGIQRFDPHTETFTTYPTHLIDTYINDIIEDELGNIWVGTMDGLYRISSPNGTFEVDDVQFEQISATVYPDTLLRVLEKAAQTSSLKKDITQVTENQVIKKSFSVDQRTTLTLLCTGEYGGIDKGMVDYGWITNSKKETIWKMDYRNSYVATSQYKRGDHPANRRVIQTLSLDPGTYQLHYRSNGKHHYKDWDLSLIPEPFSRKNGILPSLPEFWGIQLFSFDQPQLAWVEQQLMQVRQSPFVSGSSINDLFIDKHQQLWIASSGGVDRLDTKVNPLSIDHFHANNQQALSFQSDFCSHIYEGKNGILWFSGHQLNVENHRYELILENFYPEKSNTDIAQVFYEPTINHDTRILEDSIGNLWMTAYFKGLYQLTPDFIGSDQYKAEIFPFVTPNARIHFIDKFNVMWIGVWKEGIYKLNPSASPYKFVPLPKEAKSHVTTFVEDNKGIIYIGTNNQGVYKWDKKQNSLTPITTALNINQEIISLEIDDQRRLWIGIGRRGIEVYDLANNRPLPNFPSNKSLISNSNFKAIQTDLYGNKWFSSDKGIFGYHPKTNEFVNYRELSDIIWDGASSILVDQENTELILLDNISGLHVVDLQLHQQDLKNPPIKTYFKDINFKAIGKDLHTGHLWVGLDNGLMLVNKNTKAPITNKHLEQFNSTAITNILSDKEGYIWLSTPTGIVKFSPTTGESHIVNAHNGIHLNEHDAGPSKSTSWGEIIVGGKDGFYHFQPNKVQKNRIPPEVQITRIATSASSYEKDSAELEVLNPTNLVTLRHYQNTFEVDYLGLHFDEAQEKQYTYRMVGLNDNWINVGNSRIARFNTLQPGNYTFQVKADNGNGVWNEEGASIAIQVLPPWWKTIWAYLAYLLVFLATVYWIYRTQINRIQLKLIEEQANSLKDLIVTRDRLFAIISHDLRKPALAFRGISKKVNFLIQNKEFEVLNQLGNEMEKSAFSLNALLDNLLNWALQQRDVLHLRPSRVHIAMVLEEVIDLLSRFATEKSIAVKVDIPTDTLAYIDPDAFSTVIRNLLDNAIKYTPPNGNITLQARTTGQEVIISIKDTGVGMSPDQLENLFKLEKGKSTEGTNQEKGTGLGLSLVRDLVKMSKGTLKVSSIPQVGSEFIISLPIIGEKKQLQSIASVSARKE